VPSLGRHRLDKLQPAHLTAFYPEKSRAQAAGSVRRLHAVLRRDLNIAVWWRLIAVNPATLVEPPPLGRFEIQPWSVEEARIFLADVAGLRVEGRWVVGLALRLRQGETLGLAWEDIDFTAAILRVRRSLQRQPDGTLPLTQPKTPRSQRLFPLPGDVLDALVFTTGTDTPIHPRNDNRSF
jgi:integrase